MVARAANFVHAPNRMTGLCRKPGDYGTRDERKSGRPGALAPGPPAKIRRNVSARKRRPVRACRVKPAIDKARDQRADDGRHPEQPELVHRPAAREQRRRRAARRIDRGVGDRDARSGGSASGTGRWRWAQTLRRAAMGRAQDHEQEGEGHHHFADQAAASE